MASPKKQGMRKRGKLAKERKEVDKKNIKGMANPMRTQIQTILNERMNSATRIAKELGVDFGEVAYEIGVLRDLGVIEVVKEVKRRGAVEVFYRAVSRAYLSPGEWLSVADPVKEGLRASLLRTLLDDAVAAIDEETYDSLEGAHMSWSPLVVDKQGWEALMALLLSTMEEAVAIHEASKERLIVDDAKGISCTVSILGYPSAHEERKVGPPTDARELVSSTKQPSAKAKNASKKKATSKKAKAADGAVGKAGSRQKRKSSGK